MLILTKKWKKFLYFLLRFAFIGYLIFGNKRAAMLFSHENIAALNDIVGVAPVLLFSVPKGKGRVWA